MRFVRERDVEDGTRDEGVGTGATVSPLGNRRAKVDAVERQRVALEANRSAAIRRPSGLAP